MVTIAVVLAFIGTVLGVMALLTLVIPTPNPHAVRVQQIQAAARRTEPVELTSPRRQGRVGTRVQQIAERLGGAMPSQSPKAQSKRRNLLVQAGYRKANAVLTFQGCRILLAVLLPGAFLLVAPYLKGWTGAHHVAAILGLVAAGLFLPHWWLLRRIKSRQEEISAALPNALDLLVVCVEAGLGLDATIQRLAQEQQFTQHALSEELQIVSQEVRAGRSRPEALMALKERVGIVEISSLVVVLIQADRLGTGIARALRVHADSLRTKRRQWGEEQAQKMPVKMIFPLVLLIAPALLLVLLGPPYITLFKALTIMKR
ncbi:MAG TPA: type II secretion system F family protein [Anaerolineales bacterium]|nr:type II secretion system F family protein [Anaerolineales bacterium]